MQAFSGVHNFDICWCLRVFITFHYVDNFYTLKCVHFDCPEKWFDQFMFNIMLPRYLRKSRVRHILHFEILSALDLEKGLSFLFSRWKVQGSYYYTDV
jgi:hypothetical protein